MRAAGVEVGLDVGEVDVEQAEALRAVDQRQDAALARAARHSSLAGIRSPTVLDRCVKRQHLRPRRDRLGEGVDVVVLPGMRVLLRDVDDREPEALGLLPPGGEVARMVVGMDDDLVAGLEVEAVRDEVVRLAGVAGDDDLVGRDAQELGERLARVLLLRDTAARGCSATGRDRRSAVSRVSASSTGREAGQRLAAFITARSGGITNWSRTLFQNTSPVGRAARRECRSPRRLLGPRRIAEERRRAAEREQPREMSS